MYLCVCVYAHRTLCVSSLYDCTRLHVQARDITHTHEHTCTHTQTRTQTQTHAPTYTSTHTHKHTHTRAYMHARTHAHPYTHMHAHMHAHTHTHTHTHTCTHTDVPRPVHCQHPARGHGHAPGGRFTEPSRSRSAGGSACCEKAACRAHHKILSSGCLNRGGGEASLGVGGL